MQMKQFLLKLNPVASKKWLHLAAGIIWSAVGITLVVFAASWLKIEKWPVLVLLLLGGAALGVVIYLFGFSRLAIKNIKRINAYLNERICFFAFQKWTTYPLIAFMIILGIYLRKYSSLPKPILSIMYLGLGFSLFASSLHYYRQLAPARVEK